MLLLLLVLKISAKKSIEELCLMKLKSDAKFEEKLICSFEADKIWWILTWALEILKVCTLIGSFYVKYTTFDLKKYRRIIFHGTEEWRKIWRKTDLWFKKWREEYGKFSSEHLRVSKLGLWLDSLTQSRKSMSLNFTEE